MHVRGIACPAKSRKTLGRCVAGKQIRRRAELLREFAAERPRSANCLRERACSAAKPRRSLAIGACWPSISGGSGKRFESFLFKAGWGGGAVKASRISQLFVSVNLVGKHRVDIQSTCLSSGFLGVLLDIDRPLWGIAEDCLRFIVDIASGNQHITLCYRFPANRVPVTGVCPRSGGSVQPAWLQC
jgi:hypothetical protein